ncbi:MAG: lysozyme [Paraclostridium sp.]
MKTSQKGIDLIKSFEGCRLETYKCSANVNTIGYGTTKGVVPGMKISLLEAEEMLKRDLIYFERWVEKLIEVELTQNQFDALVSFTYNLGEGALKNSTLRKFLNDKRYDLVPGQFLRWNMAGGKVLNGLVRRREAEAKMFRGE